MGLRVVITGTTGMIGKGTLLECLESEKVESVLSITRSSVGLTHPKLEELLISDLMNIDDHRHQLKEIDACFYCMGISSVGMSEANYTHLTFNFAKAVAETLFQNNPEMTFNFISGAGTDSSEKGRTMWANVKGKTENMILGMGFKDAYCFRPGMIIPEKGVTSRTRLYRNAYKITRPLFPLFRKMNSVVSTTDIGKAMIQTSLHSNDRKILDPKDIKALSKEFDA